jgi:hypothetical protein
MKLKFWQRNIFYRTYRDKKQWDYSERIASQTAPNYEVPRKVSYFRFLMSNMRGINWCKLGWHEYQQSGVMSRKCAKCGDVDLNV